MKTDRTRDMLKYLVIRAVHAEMPLATVTDGLRHHLHDRAQRIYAAVKAERDRKVHFEGGVNCAPAKTEDHR